jgi:hypothetical protein
MIELFAYSTPNSYEGCLYGSENRRNSEVKRSQAVALILCLTLSFLMFNEKLRKLYSPLAKIVNISFILRILGCLSYFAYYPYQEDEGNCTELVLYRVYNGVIMLGEMHQVFFLANFLGMGRFKIKGFSLSQILKFMTIIIFATIFMSLFFRKLLMIRNLWSVIIAYTQIYIIQQSRLSNEYNENSAFIKPSNASVRIFEKCAYCQLLPSAFSFVKRFLSVFGISLFGTLTSVPMTMDEIVVFLFYVKTLIIVENSDVEVEIV